MSLLTEIVFGLLFSTALFAMTGLSLFLLIKGASCIANLEC